MKAKEFVLSHVPNARAESHLRGANVVRALQKKYWLIRDGRASMWMGCGDTQAEAWKDAKNTILVRLNAQTISKEPDK